MSIIAGVLVRVSRTGCWLLLVACLSAAAGEAPKPVEELLNQARYLMASQRWPDAARVLAGYDGQQMDVAAYMQAYALTKSGAPEAALKILAGFGQRWPTSEYRHKADMLLADIYLARKSFTAAEELLRSEAQYILSAGRKRDVADIYLKIAEAATAPPAAGEPAQKQPDYDKALRLYDYLVKMDVPDDIRELASYRRGQVALAAGRYGEASRYFGEYFASFDPFWRAEIQGELPGEQQKVSVGPHLVAARVAYVEAALRAAGLLPDKGKDAAGRPLEPQAPLALDNLLRHLAQGDVRASDPALAITALYLKPFVSGLTLASPEPAQMRRAVSEARAFVKAYPLDERSLELMRLIPEGLLGARLTDDALAAYRMLITGEGLATAEQPPDAEGLTPAERLRRYQAEAVYRSGKLFFEIGKLDGAAEVWRGYLKAYPDGPRWTEAQTGIYQAMKIQGAKSLAAKRFEDCRRIWKQVISERPLDSATPWLAMSLALTYSAEADALAEEKKEAKDKKSPEILALYRQALDELARVGQRYPAIAAHVHFERAEILRHKLADLEAAVNEYRLSNLWQARQALEELTRVHLCLETRRVFRNRQAAVVDLKVRNIPKVTVKVYKINLEDFFNKYHQSDEMRRLDLDLVSPDRAWEVEIPKYAKYRDIDYELPVEVDGPGAYAVMVESDEYEATTLVLKSNIEFVAAASYDEVVVLVKDATSEKPLAGAKVQVYGGDKKEHSLLLVSGADGVAVGKFAEAPTRPELQYFVTHGGNVAVSGGIHAIERPAGLRPKGYIYTSRPVYLPGETVQVRGVIRAVEQGAYAVAEGAEYSASLLAPDGRRLLEQPVRLGAFGTFSADFALPAESALGGYTVLIERKEPAESYSAAFQVQLVEPRKVYVEITPSALAVVAGDPLELALIAAYYTGLPLVNRVVTLQLPDGRRASLVTDKDGKATYPVDTSPYLSTGVLAFGAEIPGEDATTAVAVRFMPAALKMEVKARQKNYYVKQRLDLDISLSAPDDKPLAGRDVTVEVYQPSIALIEGLPMRCELLASAGAWPAGKVRTRDEKLAEQVVQTDAAGKAVFSYVPAEAGEYKFLVSATDDKKRTLSEEQRVQVTEAPSPVLALAVPSATVKVGERVRVAISNADPAALGLLLFTGDSVISYRVHRFEQGASEYMFHVEHSHFPNFTLLALATGEQRLNRAEQPFDVQRTLAVELKLPEGPLAPGSEAEATVLVKDQNGQPVEAELALSLVDKGLLALYPDTTANIVAFFEKGLRRTAVFREASSITFKRLGQMRQIPKAVLEEAERLKVEADRARLRAEMAEKEKAAAQAPASLAAAPAAPLLVTEGVAAGKVRAVGGSVIALHEDEADLEDVIALDEADVAERSYGGRVRAVRSQMQRFGGALMAAEAPRRELAIGAYWLGSIVTGKDGKASVRIQAPERTSQYRLQLRGVTRDTLLGQIEHEVTVRRDLFIDLKLPGCLIEGDRVRPVASVHNSSDFQGEVSLRLDMITEERRDSFPLRVRVDGRGVFEVVSPPYNVPATDALVAVLSAQAAGRTLDSLTKEARVRLWGVEERASRAGSATQAVAFTLNLPPAVRRETVSLALDLYPGVEAALLDMAFRPAEGVLDIGNKALACRVLALGTLLEELGGGRLLLEQAERVRQAAKAGVAALLAGQNRDGSFGWSSAAGSRGTPTDVSTTAWAALALSKAGKHGLLPEAAALDRVVNYLKRAAGGDSGNLWHFEAQYALAAAGSGEFAVLNRHYRSLGTLDAVRKSLLGLALAAMEKGEYAGNVARAVLQDVQAMRGTFYGDKSREVDPAYTRALALLLLGRLGGFEKEAGELAGQVRQDIDALAVSGAARWLALVALAVGGMPAGLERASFSVDVAVNDKPVMTYRGEAGGQAATVPLKWPQLGALPARITLGYKGRGTLAYRAVLRGFSPAVEARQVFHWGLDSEVIYHSPMLYKGRRLCDSSMKVAQVAYDDHVEDLLNFSSRNRGGEPGDYVVVTRWVPAGTVVDRTSVPSSAVYARHEPGMLTLVFRGRAPDLRLRLLPFCPGEYRALPSELASAERPGDYERLGGQRRLSVLAAGEPVAEAYKWSDGEHVAFGCAYFNDGDYGDAEAHLANLDRRSRIYYRDVVKALLWIYSTAERYRPAEVVDLAEVLQQRYPDVNIPYEKLLVVGRAYHDSREDEAACYLWRTTLENSFRDDIPVAAELEQAGEYMRGVEYLGRLFREYPDLPLVQQTLYNLSQDVYAHKQQAPSLKPSPGARKDRLLPEDVIGVALVILKDFLAYFPDLPYSDEAAFSMLNAYLELGAHDACLKRAEEAVRLYPQSKYADRYKYIRALAAFHLQRFDDAIAAAEAVSRSSSPDSKYATFILGQMYQALGRHAQALEAYRKVKGDFDDAAFSIEYLERRSLSLPEAVTAGPGEPVEAEIAYCNVNDVEVLAYRVDLMRLFLKERNLERIAGVNLAGITPTFTFTRRLPPVEPGITGKTRISLPIKEVGAYLVLAHAGDVFASGLVLVSPLKMEVQQYEGLARVTLRDSKPAGPAAGVRVTASNEQAFVSAETDLRGSASLALSGGRRITVIARRGKDEYAFYRSAVTLEEEKRAAARRQRAVQYDEGILGVNVMMQQEAAGKLRGAFERRAAGQQGVQAQMLH